MWSFVCFSFWLGMVMFAVFLVVIFFCCPLRVGVIMECGGWSRVCFITCVAYGLDTFDGGLCAFPILVAYVQSRF